MRKRLLFLMFSIIAILLLALVLCFRGSVAGLVIFCRPSFRKIINPHASCDRYVLIKGCWHRIKGRIGEVDIRKTTCVYFVGGSDAMPNFNLYLNGDLLTWELVPGSSFSSGYNSIDVSDANNLIILRASNGEALTLKINPQVNQ